MKALDRYLFRRLAGRFAVFSLLFLTVIVGGQIGVFIGRGAPPEVLLPVLWSFAFIALPVALPLAMSTAVFTVVGAMARDGELHALASAGIDPVRTVLRLWPAVLAGVLVFALLMHVVMPMGSAGLRSNLVRIFQAMIAKKVAEREPFWEERGVTAWAGDVQGRSLSDVYMVQNSEGRLTATYAPRARWGTMEGGLVLDLEDVRMIQRAADGRVLVAAAPRWSTSRANGGKRDREPDTMSTPQVLEVLEREGAAIAAAEAKGGTASRHAFNNSRLTLHLRLYMPIALIGYALFAAGLAVVLVSGESLLAVAIVVVVTALATYPAIGYVKGNPMGDQVHPALLLWPPGIVLGLLGYAMLRHPARAAEILAAPFARLRRAKPDAEQP